MPPRKRKTKTKKATKKATPRTKSKPKPAKQATQLQVMTEARAHFGKKYEGQVELLSERDTPVPYYISTQSLALDSILGNEGMPGSRIVVVTGDEGVGKSTFGDHVMAEMQAQGAATWIWDTENARDKRYQEKIGIIRARAGRIACSAMEDGFELMTDMIQWHNQHHPHMRGLILWDTIAGTPTRKELDPDQKDEQMGPAKVIRSHLRKLVSTLEVSKWLLIAVNQTYQGRTPSGYAVKKAYGGGGFPYYCSQNIEVSHPQKIWRSKTHKETGHPPVGQVVWVKTSKNRVYYPFRSKQICIHYGEGVNNTWTIYDTLKNAGLIKTSGSWTSFDPDGMPEAAALFGKSWQGGHFDLEDIVKEVPELWPLMLKAFQEVDI